MIKRLSIALICLYRTKSITQQRTTHQHRHRTNCRMRTVLSSIRLQFGFHQAPNFCCHRRRETETYINFTFRCHVSQSSQKEINRLLQCIPAAMCVSILKFMQYAQECYRFFCLELSMCLCVETQIPIYHRHSAINRWYT